MSEIGKWQKYNPTQAFLVALDISGFSNELDPDRLLTHRMNFFISVEETRLFATARDQEAVAVHFLGDELRLAFHAGLGAREVRGFVDDVFARLNQVNKQMLEQYRTRIKGVVLGGVVTWKTFHNCDYLNGETPIKAQMWMGHLAPDEVAINEAFRQALRVGGVPTSSFPMKVFLSGEKGYLLRS